MSLGSESQGADLPEGTPSPEPPRREGGADPSRPYVYRSADLLGGRSEAWIDHVGEMYRLRLTSSGKLYLTK